MQRVLLLFLLLFVLNRLDAQVDTTVHKDYNVKIKVSAEWIEKVRHFDYSKSDKELITAFEGFIKPDTLFNPHAEHVAEDYGRVFDPLFANLDGESDNELICLLGWDVSSPYLCVFKEENGTWYLIYLENFDTFYGAPTLYVANNYSKYKTFYFRHVDDHGSDVFIDSYSFYKLIGNKVYHCLDLLNDAHIYGWGLYMNQSVTSSFEFNGDESDGVLVDYNYDFFPGAIKAGDCSWCANADIPIIKNEGSVSYEWNDTSMTYKLNIMSYEHGIDDLTADKIACFGDFGDDTLFVRAFRGQINEVLKTGTLQQKQILTRYLALVKKDKTATTEKLVVTTQSGGMTFYGVEKKKTSKKKKKKKK